MADFEDCIRSAQKQGFKISDEDAEELIARYNEHRKARAAAGDKDPEGAAKTALAAEKEGEAAVKKAMAVRAEEAHGAILDYVVNFRDLNGNPNIFEAFANLLESKAGGVTSWRYRADARAFLAHAEVEDFISTFHRKFFSLSGKRFNKPQIDNVGREMLGEATGSAEAKGMGEAMSGMIERLRTDFNKAAGYEAIAKLDGGYLPQYHDARALLGVPGKTAAEKFKYWRDRELPRLDLARMSDPMNIGAPTRDELEKGMRIAWNRIVTGGWSDQKPTASPLGRGAIANQRSEHRFFHYKSFDDWNASNNEFGSGDVTKTIFQHVRSMSQDITAMEMFGPNPHATVEWMKQVVESETAKALIGEPSLHAGKVNEDTGKVLANRLQSIFNAVRGPEIMSIRIANGFGDVSNVLTSAYLGSTSVLAASTDPFIDRAARSFNGLPHWKALWGIVHAMKQSQTKEQMVRSGVGLDDWLHIMGNEARYAGTLGGHRWSQTLADRTVTWSGLNAITQSRKHRFGSDWQAMAADHAGETWDQLGNSNGYFRRAMENYGFNAKDWDALRKTDLFIPKEGSAGFLQPSDVKNRDLGVRYLSMILAETERAVPTQTKRSRSIVTANLQRGTVMGEIINSGLQFKSFALSFGEAQTQAMKMELHEGPARGAAYAASMFIPLTLGGAMAVQINNIINGKDTQPMDNAKFWLQAMFKGGGLGLLGDFLFADMTRFGHTVGEQLSGPTISLISDAVAITVGNAQKALTGKKTHVGRELVRVAGRSVPVVSSLLYTRAAYQRMVLDQLQYAVDPDAHKKWREQESRLRRENSQGYYWKPGEMIPERAPEFNIRRP